MFFQTRTPPIYVYPKKRICQQKLHLRKGKNTSTEISKEEERRWDI